MGGYGVKTRKHSVSLRDSAVRNITAYTIKTAVISVASALLIFSSPLEVQAGSGGDHAGEGKKLYDTYCAICHGEQGKGDGVNSVEMDPVPRDFTDSGKEKYMAKRSVEEIYEAISGGGSAIDKSSLMPAFKNTLSEHEMWSLVSYVSKLCKTKSWDVDFSKKMNADRPAVEVKAVEIPDPSRRDKMMGKRAYGKYGCSGCHEIRERGGESGPHLDGVGAKLKPQQIYAIVQNARSVKKDSAMPVYALNEETAISITKFLMLLE